MGDLCFHITGSARSAPYRSAAAVLHAQGTRVRTGGRRAGVGEHRLNCLAILATVQGLLEAAWRLVEASDDLVALAERECALGPQFCIDDHLRRYEHAFNALFNAARLVC
jgi:hypothetical protein